MSCTDHGFIAVETFRAPRDDIIRLQSYMNVIEIDLNDALMYFIEALGIYKAKVPSSALITTHETLKIPCAIAGDAREGGKSQASITNSRRNARDHVPPTAPDDNGDNWRASGQILTVSIVGFSMALRNFWRKRWQALLLTSIDKIILDVCQRCVDVLTKWKDTTGWYGREVAQGQVRSMHFL